MRSSPLRYSVHVEGSLVRLTEWTLAGRTLPQAPGELLSRPVD